MIIGTFSYDLSSDTYSGAIRSLLLDRSHVQLRPTRRSGEREPDYRVVQDLQGEPIELGAAWSRRSDAGQTYLSVVLDDPSLDKALNAALFMGDGGKASLVWSRPRPEAKPEPDAAPAKARRALSARGARLG